MFLKKLFYTFFLVVLLLQACRKNHEDSPGFVPKYVVEGWIDQGDYPYVLLTQNSPFFADLDSNELEKLIIRYAKVTVSDGSKTEVLTLRKNKNYFPPFLYQGTGLKGEVGKTYTLTVEYAGKKLTAVTEIPKPVQLDSIWFEGKTPSDTMKQLNLKFTDPANEKNYYRIYTKRSTNKRFVPTLLSNQDDKYFQGKKISLAINQGPESNLTLKNEPLFVIGDTVSVKFSTVPEAGFNFWSSFQDEVLNSGNPLIGSSKEIKSTIQGPAAGIWCGYGITVYQAVVK